MVCTFFLPSFPSQSIKGCDFLLAQVNQRSIYLSEFETIWKRNFKWVKEQGLFLTKEEKGQLVEKIIDYLIVKQLFTAYALKSEEIKDIDSIEDLLVDTRDVFNNLEIKEELKKRKLATRKKYREIKQRKEVNKKDILELLSLRSLLQSLQIRDRDKDERDVVQSLAGGDEAIHVRHILFKTDEKMTISEKMGLKKKLDVLREQILQDKNFVQMAKDYSDAKDAGTGGDLGFITKNQILKEIEQQAFATKTGKLSPVFETEFGFHIVKVEGRGKLYMRHYGKVYNYNQGLIANKMIKGRFENLRKELMANAKISWVASKDGLKDLFVKSSTQESL